MGRNHLKTSWIEKNCDINDPLRATPPTPEELSSCVPGESRNMGVTRKGAQGDHLKKARITPTDLRSGGEKPGLTASK